MTIQTMHEEVERVEVYDTDLASAGVTLEITFKDSGAVSVYFDSYQSLKDHFKAAMADFDADAMRRAKEE